MKYIKALFGMVMQHCEGMDGIIHPNESATEDAIDILLAHNAVIKLGVDYYRLNHDVSTWTNI